MKVALLGGDGFIGYNLYEILSKNYNCFSISKNRSIFRSNFHDFIKLDPYIEFLQDNYDVYIHLIDNRNAEYNEKNILKQISSNSHIILFSSAVIYANPNSEYGIRKLNIEEEYRNYCYKNNINLTILRLFNVYGKYQIPYRQGSLIANILYNHINDIPTHINDINITRDFIFVENIANYIKCIIEDKIYGTYDLATGKLYSISDVIKLVESIASKKVIFINYNKEDISCPVATNFIPCNIRNIDLSHGLKKTFDFYKSHMQLIGSLFK